MTVVSNEELAINGGRPAKTKPFPEWPMYDEREITAVTNVLTSRQWWRIIGSQAETFEREFAAYHNAKHALLVTNGTQAIEIALAALGIGYGHEVIVPAYTFISTASALLTANVVPVLVDVLPDTYCIDPDALEAAITPRTRAIMPVHMAGQAADMDRINEIAQRNGLAVIEDAAHAHGAESNGRRIGTLSDCSIFSFQSGKLMTAGEGGLIMTNDPDLLERCFLFHSCGRPKTDRTYQHSHLGSNSRISELQAAVLRVQLTRLDEQIACRAPNAAHLTHLLESVSGITPQGRSPFATRDPHYMYMFQYDPSHFGGLSRLAFVDMLIAEGVPAFVGYPAIHQTPVFYNQAFAPRWRADDPLLPIYRDVRCPVSEKLGDEIVWLHHRVLLGDEQDIVELVAAIKKIQTHATMASFVGVR